MSLSHEYEPRFDHKGHSHQKIVQQRKREGEEQRKLSENEFAVVSAPGLNCVHLKMPPLCMIPFDRLWFIDCLLITHVCVRYQKLLCHKRTSRPVENVQGSPLWRSLLFSKKTAHSVGTRPLPPGACGLVDGARHLSERSTWNSIAGPRSRRALGCRCCGSVPRWLDPQQGLRGLIDPHAHQYLVLLVAEILSISMCL